MLKSFAMSHHLTLRPFRYFADNCASVAEWWKRGESGRKEALEHRRKVELAMASTPRLGAAAPPGGFSLVVSVALVCITAIVVTAMIVVSQVDPVAWLAFLELLRSE